MKKIFKNKQILSMAAFLMVSVLAIAFMLPQVLGNKMVAKEPAVESRAETTSDDELAVVNIDEGAAPGTEEKDSTSVDNGQIQIEQNVTEPEAPTVVEKPENEVEKPIMENDIIKVFTETAEIGNIKFNYKGIDENNSLSQRPVRRYRAENIDEIEIDSETNVIYSIKLYSGEVPENSIAAKSDSEADLKAAADKIAAILSVDAKRYNSYRVQYSEHTEHYEVCYDRMINGYRASEFMAISFNKNLEFCGYYATPNVFDGVDVSDITLDEQKILEDIYSVAINSQREDFGYSEIISIKLTVKSGKVVATVEYIDYNKNNERMISNAIGLHEYTVKQLD